ncbi:MAG TPA: single-stranded-DNA-specific exonuclease RecJ [Tepidisphaeraceae bacterium]|nr:single-stranded-DNA-specific exonuclease RecJ [Tepidisphaeraceae bacterium]
MQQAKRWIIAPPSEAAERLAVSLKTSLLVAQMLVNRGITEAEDGRRFLSPSLMHLHDPATMPGIQPAAERIVQAIRQGERIVIYGDYDVDGITATAILWHAIKLLGGQVEFYIPHRLEEGYGMNAEAIGTICDGGAKLIVSVDCGITALAEAKLARERGVDLIITDHHEPQTSLPECVAVVHPRLGANGGASTYPNPNLCGAGVAFKLAWAIGQAHAGGGRVDEAYKWFLVEATGLAALGTIADVVPLVGENRILARFGLGGLKQSQLVGIKALIESAGLTGQKLDSYHVGFLLAPRLNACGRMGHARQAVEMLTSADEVKAREIAAYLDLQNRSRQELERRILDEALQQVEKLGLDKDDCRGIVLAGEGWHSGVIGIVASRLVNRLYRPTVLVATNNGRGQGSGRSIPGFHLAKALQACGEHLEGSGGHEMAAGLRLETAKFEAFRDAFCAYASNAISPEMLLPVLHLDCVAELWQVTAGLVMDLQRLGPFGTGNRKPLLCCQGVEVACAPRRVGRNGDHLQMLVRQGSATMKCIGFHLGELCDRVQPGVKLDLAAEPMISEFNGRQSVELEIKDVHIG